jgi:hypothetical protein
VDLDGADGHRQAPGYFPFDNPSPINMTTRSPSRSVSGNGSLA